MEQTTPFNDGLSERREEADQHQLLSEKMIKHLNLIRLELSEKYPYSLKKDIAKRQMKLYGKNFPTKGN